MGVLGQTKEILQICVAMIVLHEHLTPSSIIGVIISIFGLLYYKRIRYQIANDNSMHRYGGLQPHNQGGVVFLQGNNGNNGNNGGNSDIDGKRSTLYEVGKSMFNRYRGNSIGNNNNNNNNSNGLSAMGLGSASKSKGKGSNNSNNSNGSNGDFYYGGDEEDVMLIQIGHSSDNNSYNGNGNGSGDRTSRKISYEPLGQVCVRGLCIYECV